MKLRWIVGRGVLRIGGGWNWPRMVLVMVFLIISTASPGSATEVCYIMFNSILYPVGAW
jgi:hypothetical protein